MCECVRYLWVVMQKKEWGSLKLEVQAAVWLSMDTGN